MVSGDTFVQSGEKNCVYWLISLQVGPMGHIVAHFDKNINHVTNEFRLMLVSCSRRHSCIMQHGNQSLVLMRTKAGRGQRNEK